ncbi:CocE/NonD family hydrolase C-terminal non-catalytic domain-containing protein [Nocardia tengchongensis]|uniref:CocE/NonD family hydrolase C-terminal non-catalytic domain-containing protein n=1 Tax=Nocardia tengchongensis TaxID=2055889 RepID=UPI0036D05DBB
MTEPVQNVTNETLESIAANGMWADGLTFTPEVVQVARALLAAVRGVAPAGVLPPELQEVVDTVRGGAAVEITQIPGADGVLLSALTVKLNGSEPCPVVVIPAGWSPLGWLPFVWTYLTLAVDGYHVLAYTPRGLGTPGEVTTSQGFIDVAGEKDRADGHRVLDYAQELFGPSPIGMLGESYGSGLSQLIAATDPEARVSAVVALSTWGNLATSLYDNGTRHLAAMQLLVDFTGGTPGKPEEKFDPDTLRILDLFERGEDMDEVVAWGLDRSPESFVELTNSRGIATFMSNTWHETLFPINEVLETFERLTVPKRLNVWIGNHGAPEAAGLVGIPLGFPFPGLLTPMREARDWLDIHLKGIDRSQSEPVSDQIMFTYRTRPIAGGAQRIIEPAPREAAIDWSQVGTETERWYLGNGGADGTLVPKPETGWTRSFTIGDKDSPATSATAVAEFLKSGQRECYGNPQLYRVGDFERDRLLIWQTEPLTGGRRVRGIPSLHLSVGSTAPAATLVAYLFDVAPDGTARIITHEPCTLFELVQPEQRVVRWRLQGACYDIPDGHRLALVVNGYDKLYSYSPPGTTTITSPEYAESYLDLELG